MGTSFSSRTTGDLIGATDVDQFIAPVNNIESGISHYGVGGSGTDTYTVTLTPTVGSLAAGFWLHFKADATNGGACTISVNGLSAKSIKTRAGADPSASAILSGGIYKLVYDGTNFQLL